MWRSRLKTASAQSGGRWQTSNTKNQAPENVQIPRPEKPAHVDTAPGNRARFGARADDPQQNRLQFEYANSFSRAWPRQGAPEKNNAPKPCFWSLVIGISLSLGCLSLVLPCCACHFYMVMVFCSAMKDMTVPIDRAGRVVLPQEIRQELDIKAGDRLRISVDGLSVRLMPAKESAGFIRKGKALIFSSPGSPVLTQESVQRVLEESRTERHRGISGGVRPMRRTR
jgi:AbrB family looped-hinge helix DNA binding protein